MLDEPVDLLRLSVVVDILWWLLTVRFPYAADPELMSGGQCLAAELAMGSTVNFAHFLSLCCPSLGANIHTTNHRPPFTVVVTLLRGLLRFSHR